MVDTADKTKGKSFARFVYGRDEPSAFRRHVLHALLVVLALGFWGQFADFLPAATWQQLTWRASLAFGVAVGVFMWLSREDYLASLKPGTSPWIAAAFFVLFPLISWMFTWSALTHGIASLVTLSFGLVTPAGRAR